MVPSIPRVLAQLVFTGTLVASTPAPPPCPMPSSQSAKLKEKVGQTPPLDLALQDEAGRPVSLRELIDKPTILTLNYFRCGGVCTPLLNGLTEVLKGTRGEPGRDYQVITVSFDERDTPAIAALKRSNYLRLAGRAMPDTAWRFLTGPQTATHHLAGSLGFELQRVGDSFVHPAAIVLLNPQGKITKYLYGVSFSPAEVHRELQEAALTPAQAALGKVQKLWLRYDPGRQERVFSFGRAAATLAFLGVAGWLLVRAPKSTGPKLCKRA